MAVKNIGHPMIDEDDNRIVVTGFDGIEESRIVRTMNEEGGHNERVVF